MAKLVAKSPCAGLLPVTHGRVTLRELTFDRITSVAPFKGKEKVVSSALEKAVGAGLPDIGRLVTGREGQICWTQQEQYFVFDAELPRLNAAVTDQSDAWACVALEGDGTRDVLARLCPLNFCAMTEGDVARSLIGHMSAIIIWRSDGYDLMVFRAFAPTLVHELETIMRSIAAQAQIAS